MTELFSAATRGWFGEAVGAPTAVQEEAWPRIAAGEDVLVSAPTGTGKTLAAFLFFLDRLKAEAAQGAAPGTVLAAGPLTMDPDSHEVTVNGTAVELTRREFDLLRYLLEHKGKVMSREVLLDGVWGFDFAGETNAVDVYIRFLRSKIDEAFSIKLIHTVRGVGYVIRDEEEKG